jgi:CRISPR/Cas system-associated exonuclease Cas4 (RecB family)
MEGTEITRDPEYEALFKAELQRDTSFKGEPKVHRGDLIYCLRKAGFRLMGVEPPEHPVIEFTVIGKTLHKLIERNFKYREEELEKEGILGTVDIVMTVEGKRLAIEVKTTRKSINVSSDIPQIYLEQLKMAMIMLDTKEGLLAILNVITADLKVWLIRISEEEQHRFWHEILRRKELLEYAASVKNPLLLPKTYWMCQRCEYKKTCDELEQNAREQR